MCNDDIHNTQILTKTRNAKSINLNFQFSSQKHFSIAKKHVCNKLLVLLDLKKSILQNFTIQLLIHCSILYS